MALFPVQAQTDFSPQRSLGQVDSAGIDQEPAEGFICPACMKGFSQPDELERHYTLEHANTGPPGGGVASNNFADLKDEVQELQTTLKVRIFTFSKFQQAQCKHAVK